MRTKGVENEKEVPGEFWLEPPSMKSLMDKRFKQDVLKNGVPAKYSDRATEHHFTLWGWLRGSFSFGTAD